VVALRVFMDRGLPLVPPAGPLMTCTEARLIEVKTTATRGPWNDFGPAARAALSNAARLAGATAWLYHWPTGGQLRVIPEAEWPA
jgi:hypothetical protein